MGSFNAAGRRYSLMTMDALKASRLGRRKGRREDNMPLPMTSNTSTIYIDNLVHAVEPVRDDELEIIDDSGKHGHQH